MKTIVKQLPCLKITVNTVINDRVRSMSKSCRLAHRAAAFYAFEKKIEWYNRDQGPARDAAYFATADRRYKRHLRRVLKVFKQYLP